MSFDKKTFTVGSHFLPYLVNGDMTNLSTMESKVVEGWMEHVTADYPSDGKHWTFSHFEPPQNHNEFGLCEVTDQHGDVHDINAMFTEVTNGSAS